MSKIPIVVVVLVVVVGGAYLVLGGQWGQQKDPGVSTVDTQSHDGNVPGDAAIAGEQPASKQAAAPNSAQSMRELPLPSKLGPGPKSLKMPDGTYLPVLNGAEGAPAVDWPEGRPYSPVIKKIIDAEGLEWYLHKDGSYTITQNLYRSDLKRTEPATTLYNPTETKPMNPEEVERIERDAKKKASGSGGVLKD